MKKTIFESFTLGLLVFLMSPVLGFAVYQPTQQALPSGLDFKHEDEPTVYYLVTDCKRGYSSFEMYKNWKGQDPHVVVVSQSVQFPDCGGSGDIIDQPRSGTVYRKAGDQTVYLFTDGGPYAFKSEDDFLSRGYRFDQVEVFVSENVYGWGENQIFSRPNETVFKYQNEPTVYLLSGNQKMPFSSLEKYYTLYSSLDRVITIPISESYNTGGQLLFGNGYLVKGSEPVVYLVSGNQLRPFATAQALFNLGFTFSDVKQVSEEELKQHSIGQAIF